MKKRHLFLIYLAFIIILPSLMVPVRATSSPCGWTSLPFTDPLDDVFLYDNESPWMSTQGDYKNPIDIGQVYFSGVDLIINFPQFDSAQDLSFQFNSAIYRVLIDTDADDFADYNLTLNYYNLTGSFDAYLIRESDSFLWNLTSEIWTSPAGSWPKYLLSITISFPGYIELNFQNLSGAIPAVESARFAIIVEYIDEVPAIYVDYAPYDPSPNTILIIVLVIVGLIGIVALTYVIIRKKERGHWITKDGRRIFIKDKK